MSVRILLVAVAVLAGLATGPWSLDSAAHSQPPLQWHDLVFVFGWCVLALLLVLGFQVLLRDGKALGQAWAFLALIAVYLVAAGVSAAALSMSRAEVAPYSFFFLSIGAGSAVGVAIAKLAFARRFENVA